MPVNRKLEKFIALRIAAGENCLNDRHGLGCGEYPPQSVPIGLRNAASKTRPLDDLKNLPLSDRGFQQPAMLVQLATAPGQEDTFNAALTKT